MLLDWNIVTGYTLGLILAGLPWLPIRFPVDFKILLLAFKVLHGLAHSYLTNLVVKHNPKMALRSAGQRHLL